MNDPINRLRRTKTLSTLVLLLTAVLLAGCGGGGADAAGGDEPGTPVQTSTVQIVDNDFEPPDAELNAGDTLTWQWAGSSQHNVVGDGLESPVQQDGTFEHTFTEPGTYEYQCTLHGGMSGTVTVVAPSDAEGA
jgi:plastocyanin